MMKYGFLLPLLGVLVIWLGLTWLPFGALLVWLGICFVWIGIAYFFPKFRPLCKRVDGQIQWVSKLLFAPYLIYLYTVWHLIRILSKEPRTHQINQQLTIGRRLLSAELDTEFDVIVDLTTEFEEPSLIREHSNYISLPILDASVPDIAKVQAVYQETKGKHIYVHCAQGHGRTGVVAALLLTMRGEFDSPCAALEQLMIIRPKLNVNSHQRSFLEQHSEVSPTG